MKFGFLNKVVVDIPGSHLDGIVCYVIRNTYFPRFVYVISDDYPVLGLVAFKPSELRKVHDDF